MKLSTASILLTVFGEAIIVTAFLLFGEPTETKYLCMIVASVIYFLWFGQGFIPWLNLKDKTNREVGSIGIQWWGLTLYSIAAIATMLAGAFYEIPFNTQLIIHLILFFFLLATLIMGKGVENQVAKVHQREEALTAARDVLKIGLNNLRRKLSVKADFPPWILERIAKMEDEARYITPNNTPPAQSLDCSFMESLKKVENALDFGDLEQTKIDELLKMCEITLAERKRVLN
ncbi:MAG: hypothetical protein FWC26_13270 [Fibromonadales bacterium]|nr:hypothetical protein [Fibromonadales bacterium]